MEETNQQTTTTPPSAPPERGRAWRIVAIVLTIHAAVLGSAVLYQGCSKSEAPSVAENTSSTSADSLTPASDTATPSDSAQAPLPGSDTLTPEEHMASAEGSIPTPLDQSLAPSILDEQMPPSPLMTETPGTAAPAVDQPTASAKPVTPKPAVAAKKTPASSSYTVKTGDTLAKIARAKSISVSSLMTANKLTSKSVLKIGQKLSVPAPAKVAVASAKTAAPVTAKKVTAKIHVVKTGESLFAIAKKYGVTAQSLMTANKLQKTTTLRVNQKLVIPSAKLAQQKAPARPAPTAPAAPTLEQEESLRPTASEVPIVEEIQKI
jgi:LysM repeat protein